MLVSPELRPIGEFITKLFKRPEPVQPQKSITKMSDAILKGLEMGVVEDRNIYLYEHSIGRYTGCLYAMAAVGLGLNESIKKYSEAGCSRSRADAFREAVHERLGISRVQIQDFEMMHYTKGVPARKVVELMQAAGL